MALAEVGAAQLDEVWRHAAQHRFSAAARALSRLEPGRQATLIEELPGRQAAGMFRFLDPAYQREALSRLSQPRVLHLVETLDPDDRARLVEAMPAQLARGLLSGLTAGERGMTAQLLGYPPESAGRYMTPEFVSLESVWTVARALAHVREAGRSAETIDALPVLARDGRLLGVVHLRSLVLAAPQQPVEALIDSGIEPVRVDEDRERAARLIQDTDALAAPVVDAQGRLLGLVTVDDAMDILEGETEEDLARAGGGSEPLKRPYFTVPLVQLVRARALWLLVLALAAVLTVNVLSAFEHTLEAVVTLALFIPLLIDTGGNVGAQSATTLVRAISVGEAAPSDLWRVLPREAAAGLLLGFALGALGWVPLWQFAGAEIASVVALSLVGICTWASAVGSAVPLLAQKLRVDPAVASAPFVTTLIDATGLLIYFLIASALLLR